MLLLCGAKNTTIKHKMTDKMPDITRSLIKMIKDKAREGTYRVNIDGIPIDVFPYVFPPQSPFSESTHTVYDEFGKLEGKSVLDIGTGTGIQAIKAALAAAYNVEATDILPEAVQCARHNVRLNGLDNKIKIYESDIFSNVEGKFDLIIANLPILNFDEEDIKLHSLSDPNFGYHKRLFTEAQDYMTPNARIVMCHANLQEKGFQELENLANGNGFKHRVTKEINSLDYNWRNYEFTRR